MSKDIEELLRRAARNDRRHSDHYHALRDLLETRMEEMRAVRRRRTILIVSVALALLLLGLLAWRSFGGHGGGRSPSPPASPHGSASAPPPRPGSQPLPLA